MNRHDRESIARRLARALGPGQPWTANCRYQAEGDEVEAREDGLRVASRGRTLERAGDAVPPEALSAIPERHLATVEPWRANHCIRKGTGRRPDRVRELVDWTPTGALATPHARMDTAMLGALSYAKLREPLGAWLEVFALERWPRWSEVMRCAVAQGHAPQAVADAAARILWRRAPVSQDARAAELHIRAETYRRQTQQAEALLIAWLDEAAERIGNSLDGTESQ